MAGHRDSPHPASPQHTRRPPGGMVPIALILIFLALALPLIFSPLNRGRGQYDQINYHLPTIRQFAHDWPRVNLSNYQSATTPGYHLLLALFQQLGLESEPLLRIVSATFTLALFALLGTLALRRARAAGLSPIHALVVCLPFVLSPYVFIPGAWIQPDNLAWLGVLSIIALTWPSMPATFTRLLAASIILLFLVFTRQIHIWSAAPIWLAAWLAVGPSEHPATPLPLTHPVRRLRAAFIALLLTLPAFALLLAFHQLWHGLTPPDFQSQHARPLSLHSPSSLLALLETPVFTLSLLACFSAFFAGWLIPAFRKLFKAHPALVIITVILAHVLALLPETTYLREPRSSGLWNAVKFLDAHGMILFHRSSPLILFLAPVGALALLCWLSLLPLRERFFAAFTFLAFVAAQSANANAWQRYLEPMLLILLALAAAGAPAPRWPTLSRIGPLALAAGLALISARAIFKEEPFPTPTNPKATLISTTPPVPLYVSPPSARPAPSNGR